MLKLRFFECLSVIGLTLVFHCGVYSVSCCNSLQTVWSCSGLIELKLDLKKSVARFVDCADRMKTVNEC